MSSYYQLEYCRRCVQMTNHTWHDNVPLRHQYTAECMKCGLKTHESAMIKLTPPETLSNTTSPGNETDSMSSQGSNTTNEA